jgi:riboflavin synthase
MFTGIVQAIGEVRALTPRDGDVELLIAAGALGLEGVAIETLQVTTLGTWRAGQRVNLEKALRAGDPLGGHYVTGHVDGIAAVVAATSDARSLRVEFEVPAPLARYVARKGSVCIDGVSLTVNDVAQRRFGVNLIPHTLEVTTLGACRPGTQVNVEVDIIARYLERMTREAGDDA